MLYFITMDDNKYTILPFLKVVEEHLGFPAAVLSYDDAFNWYSFHNSVVIFCDIERFDGNLMEQALSLKDRIINEKPRVILNNPGYVLKRYKLLKRLYNEGINSFNVHRPPIKNKKIRYPLFLRNELDHQGPVSGLINSREDLEKQLITVASKFFQSPFLPMIVEYCAVNNSTLRFHKYGAFLLKNEVIPKHLYFSDKWMIKGSTKRQTPDDLIREKEYINQNYFNEEVLRVFDIGGIGYGRIDFAISEHGIEVFEINTNPQIISLADLDSERPYVIEQFVEKFTISLQKLYSERMMGY